MPARERFRAKEERERRRLAEAKSRVIAREFRNKETLGSKEREKIKAGSNRAAESLSREIADKFKKTKEIENPKNRDRRAEEVRRLHFEDGLTQEEVAKKLGVSVHTIYRTFKKQGWEPRHSTRRKELDEGEVYQLYYDEGLTQEKVAEKLGVSESTIYRHFRKHDMKPHRIETRDEVDSKEVHRLHFEEKFSRKEVAEKLDVSERTISRIFRDQGWKARDSTSRSEVGVNEVRQLCFDEGLTQKDVAKKLNVSVITVGRIFKDHGWKARNSISWSKVDTNEVRQLYFDEGLTRKDVAKRLGVSVYTIRKTFKKQGWKMRRSTLWKELDKEEVRQLYYDKKLSKEKVAKKLGVSVSTIYRHFKEHNMRSHRIYTRDKVDSKKVHKLYFEEKLSQKEVAKKLDVTERTISRIFHNEGWKARGQTKHQNENERELPRKENRKNTQMKVVELRKKIFGIKCQICTEERKIAIHRKDGSKHNPDDLWRISNLRTVNPDEYAAVCIPCHRGVHWMMRTYGQNWVQIKSQSLMEPLSKRKIGEPLNLPDGSEPSSQAYLGLKSGFEGSEEEIRRALFGEKCQICGSRYDEKQLYLHRKDGRPHSSELTMKEKFFRTLDPKEWVFLCYSDHRGVHWAKKALGLERGDSRRKEGGAEGEI